MSKKGSSKIEHVSGEQLAEDYGKQYLTVQQVGQKYGVSTHCVRNRMKHLGIKTRPFGISRKLSKSFFHSSKEDLEGLYYKDKLTVDEIAKRYSVGSTTVYRRMDEFSIARRNQDEHGWTWKGIKRSKQGYIYVLLDSNNPMYSMAFGRGYIPEHRLVMARHLNRCLAKSEVVHHKNGIRDDNRIENLELLPSAQNHTLVTMNCQNCMLKKEIRLLRWQIKELNEQVRNLTSDKLLGGRT